MGLKILAVVAMGFGEGLALYGLWTVYPPVAFILGGLHLLAGGAFILAAKTRG